MAGPGVLGAQPGAGAGVRPADGAAMSDETKTDEPKAIARQAQSQLRAPVPFLPTNLDEAWRIAEALSKASVLPDSYKGKPSDILVAIMTGAELGLPPLTAIRECYVVHGRAGLSTAAKVALVMQSPVCEYWTQVEGSAKSVTYETRRRGHPKPRRHTFTWQDAETAGLPKNPIWRQYPQLMLSKRCQSQLADDVYPEIVRGIYTSDDELPAIEAEETLRRLDEPAGIRAPPVQARAAPEEEQKPITAETELPAMADEMLQAIRKADKASIDNLVREVSALPKDDARRKVYGDAINARRRELRGDV